MPAPWRAKAQVILPSAAARPPLAPRRRTFDVAVVGHLRAVKDPRLPMRVARALPGHSRIRLLHAGNALERSWSRAAQATGRATDRYRWLGGVAGAAARALIRRARVLLHPSKEEGGALIDPYRDQYKDVFDGTSNGLAAAAEAGDQGITTAPLKAGEK